MLILTKKQILQSLCKCNVIERVTLYELRWFGFTFLGTFLFPINDWCRNQWQLWFICSDQLPALLLFIQDLLLISLEVFFVCFLFFLNLLLPFFFFFFTPLEACSLHVYCLMCSLYIQTWAQHRSLNNHTIINLFILNIPDLRNTVLCESLHTLYKRQKFICRSRKSIYIYLSVCYSFTL